jgi:MFS family permease
VIGTTDANKIRIAGLPQAMAVTFANTLPTMAIASLVPVLPSLFAHFENVPHKELLVPMVLTVPSLCVAVFSSPIGAAADAWGRRKILLAALVMFAIAGLAPLLFDNLYAIILSRFVVGIAEAAILTVTNVLMGDYFQGETRKRWVGLQTTISPFIGSSYVLAGGFLGTWSWRGPFLMYLLGFVACVGTWFYLFEPARKIEGMAAGGATSDTRHAFPWASTFLVGGVTLIYSTVFFVQNIQHGRIFSDLGVTTPARISIIVTLASMGTAVGGFVYRSIRMRPVGILLALAFASYGVSYVGLAVVPDYRLGLPIDAIGQFGCGFGLSVLIAWALSKYGYQHRGRGMGIWGACFFLGQFLSPPVMTLIGHGRLSFLQSVGVLGIACFVFAAIAGFYGLHRRATSSD